MTTPLVEIDNEGIFSLNGGIIGNHATRTSTELLHAHAWIKVHADPMRQNSANQSLLCS
jgi:hypothetical protein